MEHQEKDVDDNSAKFKTSLKHLAQIFCDCSSGSQILKKRKKISLQGDSLNPIKKMIKLEAELQDGYKLQIEVSVVKDENANTALVKKEEASISENIKIEDPDSQNGGREDSQKPESDQIRTQK
jgi:hypothetical protein